MKALAAANIGQYEKSVKALEDYYRTVELGLSVCFREVDLAPKVGRNEKEAASGKVGAIVFGSDQGLVGQFNEVIADFAIKTLTEFQGQAEVWAVGERVQARLTDAGLPPIGVFAVPNSVNAITSLVGQIQIESESRRAKGEYRSLFVFHNRPLVGAQYEPVDQRLLPLDNQWLKSLAGIVWPTNNLPEILCERDATLRSLIREYLFISIFRACAESLASENASRLAAMQRAEKNIEELLGNLQSTFHRVRQGGIDEELFDVVSGFEAITRPRARS
jgi:F-type H+-transporting ATPase subunit gamma